MVRVHRVGRSFSVSSAVPSAVHEMPPKRYSVRAISSGAPSNGAACASTRSRCGTVARGSPPSSASAHTRVAGRVGSHVWRRGPVGTPPMGTASARGSRAIDATISPLRFRTVTSFGKLLARTSHENGRSTSTVRSCSPLGEALTRS